MNTSRFFLAGILWMTCSRLGRCRKQRTSKLPLVKQSSHYFCRHGQPGRGTSLPGCEIGADHSRFVLTRFEEAGGRFSEKGDSHG